MTMMLLKEKENHIVNALSKIGIVIEPNKIDLRRENSSVILGRDKRKPIVK